MVSESVAPATQYTNPVNGYTQPLDCSQNWSGYQVQPQVAGPSNQSSAVGGSFGGYYNGSFDTPFVNAFAAGAPPMLPAPSNSKPHFSFATSQNRMLTDHEQYRSATGGPTGAAHPPLRSTR